MGWLLSAHFYYPNISTITMQKTIIYILSIVFSLSILSFSLENKLSPSQKTKEYFNKQIDDVIVKLEVLENSLPSKNIELVRKNYLDLRVSFKSVDFLIAYLDPMLYDKKINESPLLKAEPKVANKSTHEPVGFQVLDETLFSDEIDFTKVTKLISTLEGDFEMLKKVIAVQPFYDAVVVHSIRQGLIRSFTLGVTGFDTPGSVNAISDLKSFQEALITIASFYEGLDGLVNIQKSIEFSDYNSFNRYKYLVTVINPSLESLEKFRAENGIEKREEMITTSEFPVVSTTTNLFAENFFNKVAYLSLPTTPTDSLKIALGEKLFFDKSFSASGNLACSSCHNPDKAYTDQKQFSLSGDGKSVLGRNSPSINYSVYGDKFFHDLRAHDLKNQIEHVVVSELEFNTTYENIVAKLKEDSSYVKEFNAAFGIHGIRKNTYNNAIKRYVATLPSHDSQFDKWVLSGSSNIDKSVENGFNLFMGKAQCGTCHFAPTFSGLVPPAYTENESEVLGVLENNDFENPVLDDDMGRSKSGVIKDMYEFFDNSFKTPTIRNVSHSFPYMHNGSLATLEEVMAFYQNGGGAGMGIDLEHQTLPFDSLELSDQEVADIISFMNSLTDNYLLKEQTTY